MKSTSRPRLAGRLMALAVAVGLGCGAHPQNTSSDMRRGDPPLCFQYRGEARASAVADRSNIWLLVNNTCSYTVDCLVWNDVTQTQHRILVPKFETNSYLIAPGAAASHVNFKLDCTWQL